MRTHLARFAAKFALLVAACAAWSGSSALATTPSGAPAATAPTSAAAPTGQAGFAVLPVIRDVAVSPGGKTLAWVDAANGNQRLMMYDIASQKIMRIVAIDASMTYRWLAWSDDHTLLYTVSVMENLRDPLIKREFYRMFSVAVADGKLHMMLSSDGTFNFVTGMKLLKLHTGKPNTIIVTTYDWAESAKRMQTGTAIPVGRDISGWVWVVYEIDTHTGKSTRLEVGDHYTHDWILDPDGRILGRTEWYPEQQSFSVLVKNDLGWPEIHKTRSATAPSVVELDRTGALLILEPDTDGRNKLWSLPLDGSPTKATLVDATAEVSGVFHDPVSGLVNGAYLLNGTQRSTLWFDKAEQQRYEMLSRSFPKQRCDVVSESADKQLAVIRVNGPSKPPSFYLVDLAKHQATPVGDEYPDLTDRKLGEVSEVHYKAHDGTEISAYLTVPPEGPKGLPPLVVLPHGGPDSMDSGSDFEWLRQHLATRGYAVLQPQFRGSTGFGAAFERAGDRQWGLLMQDDLTDGVRALIDQGRVDPHRICILGYSYGSGYAGYAALAGAAFTPDLYKCAISVNGVSDLPGYLGYQIDVSGKDSYLVARSRELLGDRTDPKLVERSPISAADRITASVLLLYSAGDSVVPANQSQAMADSLKNAHKSVRLVEISDADHWLSHLPARMQSVAEIDQFLQDHL